MKQTFAAPWSTENSAAAIAARAIRMGASAENRKGHRPLAFGETRVRTRVSPRATIDAGYKKGRMRLHDTPPIRCLGLNVLGRGPLRAKSSLLVPGETSLFGSSDQTRP